jgi:hypothetical protein
MVAEGREGHFHSFIDFLTNEIVGNEIKKYNRRRRRRKE